MGNAWIQRVTRAAAAYARALAAPLDRPERIASLAAADACGESKDALLHEILDSMPSGIAVYDADDRLALWSRTYESMFSHLTGRLTVGLSYREILSLDAASSLYAIATAERETWIEAVRRETDSAAYGGTQLLADGRALKRITRRTPTGGWIRIVRDVTAETKAAEALAAAKAQAEQSEALFRDGIDSMDDGLMLLDAQDRIVTWNRVFERLFSIGSQVVRRGMAFSDYIRGTQTMRWRNVPSVDVEAVIAERMSYHGPGAATHEMVAVNGRIVRATESPTSIGGIVIVFQDITAERNALDAVTAKAAEFRDGIESMLDGFAQFDAESRLINWNARYPKMFPHLEGKLTRGMSGRRVFELHAESDLYSIAPAERAAWVENSLRDTSVRTVSQFTRELADGRVIWTFVTHTASGGTIFVMRDITERTQQEARVAAALTREREVSAQQRRFVAVTAHEFRTPLTIIDGAAQRLLRYAERITPADLSVRAEKIRSAVARMSQLVDTTLNSARLDAGQIALNRVALDLAGLVVGVCRRLEGLAPGFTITFAPPESAITIEGDARLLDQVFTNLVTNAVKYSGQSRKIEISIGRVDAKAAVSVRDFGIGVPADEVTHLFTRFFRASTAKGLPGTGIGLNLVKELVALHGGEVTVDSQIGEGSCFTVRLPISTMAINAEPMRANPILPSNRRAG